MTEILSLKSEDAERLNPYALSRFKDWQARILSRAPHLRQLSIEQIKTDLDTYLNDKEKADFNKCISDITGWLSGCMDTGYGYLPYAYDTRVITPMSQVESLVIRAYQRAEAERQKKEYEDKWCAAFIAINPPVEDAKKYLNDKEYGGFKQAMGKTIAVYLEKGVAYLADMRTLDYSWWLEKIGQREKKEAQKQQATRAASEYNHRLNQEIAKLTSRLDHKQRDLASYFRVQIKDKRYNDHNFDYILSAEDKINFDHTLVSIANKKLEQLVTNGLRQFIGLPAQYYRIYFPLPSTSYSFKRIPCVDISFDIFAAAYAEVWLIPAKKSFDDYEFSLPWMEDNNDLTPLEKPKFLGYYYLLLSPEDFGGYIFWQSIPLALLKGLFNGETRSDGITISAASHDNITYKVRGFEEEVSIPDEFAEYLKGIGNIEEMIGRGIMDEKITGIVKVALAEPNKEHDALPIEGIVTNKGTLKAKVFELFDQGKRPSDPEVKILGIKPNTVYRYHQGWKKTHNHSQS